MYLKWFTFECVLLGHHAENLLGIIFIVRCSIKFNYSKGAPNRLPCLYRSRNRDHYANSKHTQYWFGTYLYIVKNFFLGYEFWSINLSIRNVRAALCDAMVYYYTTIFSQHVIGHAE